MRISQISDLIDYCNIVVDVGSDHALLSKILIDKKKCNIVYNIEKNESPFLNSIKNTSSTKYLNKIVNLKSDGFENFDSKITIDYCCLSGMGGKTIVNILSKCKNEIKNVLVCTNDNNNFVFRNWAKKNNYKFLVDKTILDNKKFYEIILVSKKEGKKIFFKNQLLFGIQSIKKNDSLFFQKLKNDYNLNLNKLSIYKNKNKKKYLYYKKVQKILKG